MVTITYDLWQGLERGEVLKEVGVGDLTRSPDTLVGGVVNHGGVPLALVVGVGLHGAAERVVS